MSKLFYLMLLMLTTACSSNLVKNGSAETLPFNEWTIASGRWTQRAKAPLPQEGKFYFFPSVAAHAEMYQDIDVSSYNWLTDIGLVNVHYKSFLRAFPQRPADQSYQVVEFRDVNGSAIDSFATVRYDSTNAWIAIDHQQSLPKGVRTIRVRLLSERFNGSNNDGYHDDVSLTVALSPFVYLVIVIPIVFIIWLLLRRKKRNGPAVTASS